MQSRVKLFPALAVKTWTCVGFLNYECLVKLPKGIFCVCFYYAGGSESRLLARPECQPCTFIFKAHGSITQSWHCSLGRAGMFCHLGGTPRLTFFCVKGLDEKRIERKKTKAHTDTARLRFSLPSKSELQKRFCLVWF